MHCWHAICKPVKDFTDKEEWEHNEIWVYNMGKIELPYPLMIVVLILNISKMVSNVFFPCHILFSAMLLYVIIFASVPFFSICYLWPFISEFFLVRACYFHAFLLHLNDSLFLAEFLLGKFSNDLPELSLVCGILPNLTINFFLATNAKYFIYIMDYFIKINYFILLNIILLIMLLSFY